MYYVIQNGVILTAKNKNDLAKFYDKIMVLPDDYEVGKYIVLNNELVLNSDFEEQKAQKERERISQLYLTRADVERGIYKAKGMDFEDIIALVEQRQAELVSESQNIGSSHSELVSESQIDIKALKIELKANNFYRGNPYVEAVGSLLGFASSQLDEFFKTGDYTCLMEVEDETLNQCKANSQAESEASEPVCVAVQGDESVAQDDKETI